MDVAIVAPCPVPYVIGGAENLFRGLQDHINRRTPHQAEIIKLPTREHSFWDLVESYRRWSQLDVTGFDIVVSTKYPAWMVRHPRHVVYMQHKLRGLYDTYHFLGAPPEYPDAPAPVRELRSFWTEHHGQRAALDELFERLFALREDASLPVDLFAFPGPFIREVLHALDAIGLAPEEIHRHGAISQTVAAREDYFPEGVEVFVAHHPTSLEGIRPRPGRGRYLLCVSRLDNAKRTHVTIEAMAHAAVGELRIAGTGPDEERLREMAAGDPRIRFLGRVPDDELPSLYEGARAVVFVPYYEDYGLITLEAMLAGKPVITLADSGGTTELIDDGVNGLVAEPSADALGDAMARLWRDRRAARRMGRAARARAEQITWEPVVRELLA